mmetsp:Transcript_7705/g.11361  ORF Transcript_7705/g.11361 Transcript_7705/m.11361 type:complete len:297 (-) Transcript_7705:1925-2815(-)
MAYVEASEPGTFTEALQKFQLALRSPEEFNEWAWIWRLSVAAKRSLFLKLTNTISARPLLSCVFQNVQSKIGDLFPVVVIALVVFVEFAFVNILYQPYIVGRWCTCSGKRANFEDADKGEDDDNSSRSCFQAEIIKYTALYFGVMILWNFCLTCSISPGLVLPQDNACGSSEMNEGCRDCKSNIIDADRQEKNCTAYSSNSPYCDSLQRNRTFLCFSVAVNETAEREKAALFLCSDVSTTEATDCIIHYYPSPFPSVCSVCGPRPPRSHHCRKCNFCILQVRFSQLSLGIVITLFV